MGITSFFTRSAIKCKDKKLQELINSWTKNEGWVFEDFAKFLELVGIKTPVQIGRIKSEKKAFKCVSEDGKEYQISLQFGNFFDFCSEIYVTEGNETIGYICSGKSEEYCPEPKVTKQTRIIEENGKSLNSYYCEFFCHRTLKLDECHKLTVEFDEPNKTFEKSNIRVIQNATKIEEYLFSLDTKLVVSEVYDKMVSLLGFSQDDINQAEKILISFEKEVDKEKRTLACIRLTHGEIQEYAILDGGETFHVYKDRSWRYSSTDTRILYRSDDDSYIFSVTAKEKVIADTTPADILNRVKERISQLWKFIK